MCFAELLESARQDYADFVRKHGMPFIGSTRRTEIIQDLYDPNWLLHSINVDTNLATDFIHDWQGLWVSLEDACLDLAANLISSYSKQLPRQLTEYNAFDDRMLFWSTLMNLNYIAEPVGRFLEQRKLQR